jgi:hypothetical protein
MYYEDGARFCEICRRIIVHPMIRLREIPFGDRPSVFVPCKPADEHEMNRTTKVENCQPLVADVFDRVKFESSLKRVYTGLCLTTMRAQWKVKMNAVNLSNREKIWWK